MALKQNIEAGIKAAMLAKEEVRLRTLRAIKAAILLAETETGAKAELSEEDELKLLTKMAKQRRDSSAVFGEQNREDLKTKEDEELAIIEEFLPAQLSEEELTVKLKAIIEKVGASAPSDMGKVMGVATKELTGVADGKAISAIVRNLLN